MPLPSPNKDEKRKDYLNRCMATSVMNKDFPDRSQRFAVCNSLWEKKAVAKLSEDLENVSHNE